MSFGSLHGRLLLLAAGAAVALAACGSDPEPVQTTAAAVTGADSGEPTTEATQAATTDPADEPAADPASDREAIAASIETVLTSSDPRAVCIEFVTERYVRRSFGDRRGCTRAQQDTKHASKVRVSRIVILPDSLAQAWVVPTGGLYSGKRLRGQLVLDSGIWKVDSLRANIPVGP